MDALRGFAVMAIILVHNLEHFIFPVYPDSSPGWLNALDQGVFNGIFSLFAGKAYAIFALLFGFTFYIQTSNQKKQGKDFGYRFLWRMVLLVGFAILNAGNNSMPIFFSPIQSSDTAIFSSLAKAKSYSSPPMGLICPKRQ